MIQQEAFDAILQPVMAIARSPHAGGIDTLALTGMLNELGEARKALQLQEQINYAELTARLLAEATARGIVRTGRDAR